MEQLSPLLSFPCTLSGIPLCRDLRLNSTSGLRPTALGLQHTHGNPENYIIVYVDSRSRGNDKFPKEKNNGRKNYPGRF